MPTLHSCLPPSFQTSPHLALPNHTQLNCTPNYFMHSSLYPPSSYLFLSCIKYFMHYLLPHNILLHLTYPTYPYPRYPSYPTSCITRHFTLSWFILLTLFPLILLHALLVTSSYFTYPYPTYPTYPPSCITRHLTLSYFIHCTLLHLILPCLTLQTFPLLPITTITKPNPT